MQIAHFLLSQIHRESKSTREMISRLPADHFDFKPHEKSMSAGRMAAHIIALIRRIPYIIEHPGLDLNNNPFVPFELTTTEALVAAYDEAINETEMVFAKGVSDQDLEAYFKMQRGDYLIAQLPKSQFIQSQILSHYIHHRGQFTVYLRLLDIPVPGAYGPSADEK